MEASNQAETKHSNLQKLAETTFKQLISIERVDDTIGTIQVTYRSAAKYFLRWVFDDSKVRKYAPSTRQLTHIDTVTADLSDEEKQEFLRLLCKMEHERCQQAVDSILHQCNLHRSQIEFTGSICRDDIWPTDLDIIFHRDQNRKSNIKKFRKLLASLLGKKIDIKVK